MYRRSSRIMLWVLAVVVTVLACMTIYSIVITNNAREERCNDVVTERQLDRLLWFSILNRVDEGDNPVIDQFREDVDKYKPPLECNDQNIPVPVGEDSPDPFG